MTTTLAFEDMHLERLPASEALQAWNAADELLLMRLRDDECAPRSLLVVNDAFGALAAALGDAVADWWSDSATAREALENNCRRNARPLPRCIHGAEALRGPYHAAVIQAPKSVSLFAWQLRELAAHLAPGARVYVLGMVKHLSPGHQKVMGRYFAGINPGRAVKKARCVEMTEPRPDRPPVEAERYPGPHGLTLVNHPGSFSEKGTDPGALAFLALFDQLPGVDAVLDVGCGNGILGLGYLRLNRDSQAILIDDSAQAIRSARDSAVANGLASRVTLHHNNGLAGLELTDLPLVLCNPPFHQHTTLTTDVAYQLFEQCAQALAHGGELWVVGNRHLDYHQRLKRWFASVAVMSRHPKFVVLRCRQPK